MPELATAPAAAPAAAPKEPAAPAPDKPNDDTPQLSGDLMTELEGLDDTPAPPPKPKAPEKPKAEIKVPEGIKEPEKPTEKAPEKPAAEKPSEESLDGPEPVRIQDLRTGYRTLKKQLREMKPQLEEAQKKLKEAESRQPEDLTPFKAQMESIQKRNQELEREMEFLNYQKSSAFKDKYEKPYVKAWNEALSDLSELTVETEDGGKRQATKEDMLELVNMPLGPARTRANQLFGDSANDVMIHRQKIRDLAKSQDEAIQEARKNGEQRQQTAALEAKTRAEQTVKAWNDANTALSKRFPKMFAPQEGDTEGNSLLQKGFALADRLFSPTEETRPKTPAEAVQLHAVIRNKAANHDRLAARLKGANARIAELQAALDEYEKHSPHGGEGGQPGGGKTDGGLMDPNAEIDAMDER